MGANDIPRPSRWLAEYGRRYPDAWRQVDTFRSAPPSPWPAWCFLPLAGAYAIASGGGDNRVSVGDGLDVAAIGALAVWRVTHGIYRIEDRADGADCRRGLRERHE